MIGDYGPKSDIYERGSVITLALFADETITPAEQRMMDYLLFRRADDHNGEGATVGIAKMTHDLHLKDQRTVRRTRQSLQDKRYLTIITRGKAGVGGRDTDLNLCHTPAMADAVRQAVGWGTKGGLYPLFALPDGGAKRGPGPCSKRGPGPPKTTKGNHKQNNPPTPPAPAAAPRAAGQRGGGFAREAQDGADRVDGLLASYAKTCGQGLSNGTRSKAGAAVRNLIAIGRSDDDIRAVFGWIAEHRPSWGPGMIETAAEQYQQAPRGLNRYGKPKKTLAQLNPWER